MKVLALTEGVPYPPDTGWRLRTWNLLSRLVGNHEITVVCHAAPDESAAIGLLRQQGFGVVPVWRRRRPKAGAGFYAYLLANLAHPRPYLVTAHFCRRLRGRVGELIETRTFDVVHCDWTPLMPNVPPWVRHYTAVTAHNIESEIWSRYLEVERGALRRWYIAHQQTKLMRFEGPALRSAKAVVTVSARDAGLARDWFGVTTTAVVANGVDTSLYCPDDCKQERGRLVYAGTMDTIANTDSVIWFCDAILPVIMREVPGATLDVVGRDPTPQVRELGKRSGVRVTARVPDVRPYLSQAEVFVVPLRVGGGTRLKILEAWAMGKAVVSTSRGCEGLAAEHGTNLLIADDPASFSETVVRLLGDPALRRGLGAAGRATAEAQYGWDALAARLAGVWSGVAAVCERVPCSV